MLFFGHGLRNGDLLIEDVARSMMELFGCYAMRLAVDACRTLQVQLVGWLLLLFAVCCCLLLLFVFAFGSVP